MNVASSLNPRSRLTLLRRNPGDPHHIDAKGRSVGIGISFRLWLTAGYDLRNLVSFVAPNFGEAPGMKRNIPFFWVGDSGRVHINPYVVRSRRSRKSGPAVCDFE
jgi:hypothetical protein